MTKTIIVALLLIVACISADALAFTHNINHLLAQRIESGEERYPVGPNLKGVLGDGEQSQQLLRDRSRVLAILQNPELRRELLQHPRFIRQMMQISELRQELLQNEPMMHEMIGNRNIRCELERNREMMAEIEKTETYRQEYQRQEAAVLKELLLETPDSGELSRRLPCP